MCLGFRHGFAVTPRKSNAVSAAPTCWPEKSSITGAGGDYVFTVKANQPGLYAACKRLPWRGVGEHSAVTTGHGRRARRTIKVVTAPACITFHGATQVAQIRRITTRAGKKTVEVAYMITSADYRTAPPAVLAAWVQGHWGIENRAHWVRDVVYDEDRSQIRTGSAPQVMATLPAIPPSACSAYQEPPASPPPCDITPPAPNDRSRCS